MTEEFLEFITACPEIAESEININYLAETPGSVSVEPQPNAEIVRRYVGGERLVKYDFKVCMRGAYDRIAYVNKACVKRLESVCDWLKCAPYPNENWISAEQTESPHAESVSKTGIKLSAQFSVTRRA